MEKLKLSITTGGWFYGEPDRAQDAFSYIRDIGFEALDYDLSRTLGYWLIEKGERTDYFDAPMPEILERYSPMKAAMESTGISISMAHGIFPMYTDAAPSMHDYLIACTEKLLAVCQYLGCPALVVHPITRRDRTLEKEMNLSMYRRLIPAARKYGVKICLENMFAVFGTHSHRRACSDIGEACWYIDTLNAEAGEELFGFCYDVGHANLLGNNLYEDLKLLGKRLTVLHIHENDGMYDLHMIPYTQTNPAHVSTTDWEGFLRGLREIGYEGPLNFETFAATENMPKEMIKPLHALTYAVGRYFRDEITK